MGKLTRVLTGAALFGMTTYAATLQFTGVLAPEVGGSSGSGSALVTYDSIAHTLNVAFDFQDLTGTTTVAHIHCCVDPPGTVGVATYPGTFPGFLGGLQPGHMLVQHQSISRWQRATLLGFSITSEEGLQPEPKLLL